MGWFADRKARKKEKAEREERLKFLTAPVIPQPRATRPVVDDPIRVYDEYGNREDPVMEAVVGTAFATGQMVTWTADTGVVVHEAPIDSSPSPAPVDCAPDTTPVDYPSDHVTACEPSPPPYETSSYDYGSSPYETSSYDYGSSSSSSYDSGSSSSSGDSGGGGGGGE